MKVLLVTDQYLNIEGDQIFGPSNFTSVLKRLAIIGELHACVLDFKTKKNPIQIFNDQVNEYIKKENLTFINKSYIWPSRKTIRTLEKKIKQVDLVIGYVPALNAEVAERLAHKAGKKYFALMVACPWDGLWNQDWKRKIAAPYRFLLNRYVLRHSDYALYVTNEFLQKRYPTVGNSVGISNVVLLENHVGVLDARIQHIMEGQKGSPIKLATTAMLNVKYKGQRFVIQALKKLKDMGYTDYHYYLIGGGDDSNLRKLVYKLGIQDQIHFVGKITHEEVFKLLDDIDIYVHPSLQEGLPRSVVEAMSRALPCIGARTAAIPELIDDEFIVERKSVNGIVNKLLKMRNKDILIEQAQRNFEEAKKYECHILDVKRRIFYESIRQDIENQGTIQ